MNFETAELLKFNTDDLVELDVLEREKPKLRPLLEKED